ncbi:MAG: hypothetical protein EOO38_32570, partial [Cytophagaceae bacterium]
MGLFSIDKCALCSEPIKFWDKAASIKGAVARCNPCRSKVREGLGRFGSEFRAISTTGRIDPRQWQSIWTNLKPYGALPEEAMAFIHADAVQCLETLIVICNADGVVTPAEEHYFQQLIGMLGINGKSAHELRTKWQRAKEFSEIKRGILPTVHTDIHLEAGELCHLDCPATFEKVNAKSTTLISGHLIVTNRKIHFLAHGSGGWTISYNSILRVTQSKFLLKGTLTFELSKKQGAGSYMIGDPAYAHLIVTTMTKIWRREIVVGGVGDTGSRHIPQHVRIAVYQRDGGKCVQCKDANYLEYDHIIPFSKGGASTLGNVQ